jgi:hypothetical protein
VLVPMQLLQCDEQRKEMIRLSHVYIAAYYYAIKAAMTNVSIYAPDTNELKFLLCVPSNPNELRLNFNQ